MREVKNLHKLARIAEGDSSFENSLEEVHHMINKIFLAPLSDSYPEWRGLHGKKWSREDDLPKGEVRDLVTKLAPKSREGLVVTPKAIG